MNLVERIREERKFKHQIGNIIFTIQIPKINYFLKNLENSDLTSDEVIRENILDWEGANEKDFIEDGDKNISVPFDREVLEEYLADRPTIVNELFSTLIEKATDRSARLAELGNGQKNGSKKSISAKSAVTK